MKLVRNTVDVLRADKWVPYELADASSISNWVGPWQGRVNNLPVDVGRTSLLEEYDVPVSASGGNSPWQGTSYGHPYNVVDASVRPTTVWDLGRPITWNFFTPSFPTEKVPFPDVIRRQGDPLGSSDMRVIVLVENQRLYEMILFDYRPASLPGAFGFPWQAGYSGGGRGVFNYDLTKRFRKGSGGTPAARVPKFPMIVRWDEIQRGYIDHTIFAVLPNYSSEKPAGWAEGTDGTWFGHPCRAGDILRLKQEVVGRFALGTSERILAQALSEYGAFVGDKSSHGDPRAGKLNLAVGLDRRFAEGDGVIGPLGDLGLRLTDFEVVSGVESWR